MRMKQWADLEPGGTPGQALQGARSGSAPSLLPPTHHGGGGVGVGVGAITLLKGRGGVGWGGRGQTGWVIEMEMMEH